MKKKLILKTFETVVDLTDFINKNEISQENIQLISYMTESVFVLYWHYDE